MSLNSLTNNAVNDMYTSLLQLYLASSDMVVKLVSPVLHTLDAIFTVSPMRLN